MLGSIAYFESPRSPYVIGACNTAVGFLFTLSMFIRLCMEDDNRSWLLGTIKRIILAVPDLQYGILVLAVFWFGHGTLDAVFGCSFEYVRAGGLTRRSPSASRSSRGASPPPPRATWRGRSS